MSTETMSAPATRSSVAADSDLLDLPPETEHDYLARNKAAWERWAAAHIARGRKLWQTETLGWGLWGTPEAELGLLSRFDSGADAIELGCGTGAIAAWLARTGIRPVAVDFARAQLHTAEAFQHEFGVSFQLLEANAEQIPYDNESFDLVISEYGASLWCDPRRWLPEASRLLRPEGALVFFTNGAFMLTCTPVDGSRPGDRLVRDYFSRYRIEFEQGEAVEFHLRHGHWIGMLKANGLVVDRLIEVQPNPKARPRFDIVSPEWAQRWPSEEIWVAHKTG